MAATPTEKRFDYAFPDALGDKERDLLLQVAKRTVGQLFPTVRAQLVRYERREVLWEGP